MLVAGSNYFNRPGRMGVSAMMALIAVIVFATPTTKAAWPPTFGRKLAIVALFLVPCLGIIADDTAWIFIGRLGSDRTVARHSTMAYRKNGEATEHMRELLGRPSISVLFADVGAASLCCKNIEILDLGPYFYSGWEALSSKKNAPAVTAIDKDYLNSLHFGSLCRLP
jgi:hypothetical protein